VVIVVFDVPGGLDLERGDPVAETESWLVGVHGDSGVSEGGPELGGRVNVVRQHLQQIVVVDDVEQERGPES